MRKRAGFAQIATVTVVLCAVLSAGESQTGVPMSGDLRKLAVYYGFPAPVSKSGRVTLKSHYTTMTFGEGSRKLHFNKTLIWLNDPLQREGNAWCLAAKDVVSVVDALLRSREALGRQGSMVVVLDPGHGGDDSGAVGQRGTHEKEVVLDLARRVRKRLRASGITVKMTRQDDRTLPLCDRSRLAARWKADAFISIHLNSAANASVSGIETFVIASPGYASTGRTRVDSRSYPGNAYERASMSLGYYVHRGLVAYANNPDRGVKRARFQVLRDVGCPSALVECGFLSRRNDERMLMQAEYRERLAKGIAAGILTYLSRVRDANAALDRQKRRVTFYRLRGRRQKLRRGTAYA